MSGWVKTQKEKFENAIKGAGKGISDAVRTGTNALGFTDTPTDPASLPQLDPAKIQAIADYGGRVKRQGEGFDPSAYGADFFQNPELATGQITQNPNAMPGPYQQRPSTAVIPGGQAMPDVPGQVAAPTSERGEDLTAWSGQVQSPNAPGQIAAPNVPQVSGQTRPEVPGMISAPTAPGQTTTPQLGNVSGMSPNLQSYGGSADLSQSKGAISNLMTQFSSPLQLTQGYDKNMRDTSIGLATSGLEQQKEAAMAQLKEQQMASGNYGSSVGQKQMMELQQNYDRQVSEAGMSADLRQNAAAREDRYKNLDVETSRGGMLLGAAGAGASTELAGKGFERDTTSMNNSTESLKAEFARQGKTIDNNTLMQMAQFAANQDQQGFANAMTQAGFTGQQAQQMFQNQVQNQTASDQQTQQQFMNDMTAKGFTAQQMQQEFTNKFGNAAFESAEGQKMFQNEVTRNEIGNQNKQREFQNDVTTHGINANQGQQEFMNQMLKLGYSDDQAQKMYQNQVGADQRNVTGDMAEYNSGMDQWKAGQEDSRYKDMTADEKERFNIGQRRDAKKQEYDAFQANAQNMRDYGQNPLDPQSVINAEARQRQQKEKADRFRATAEMAGKAGSAAAGMPGSIREDSVAQEQQSGMRASAVAPAQQGQQQQQQPAGAPKMISREQSAQNAGTYDPNMRYAADMVPDNSGQQQPAAAGMAQISQGQQPQAPQEQRMGMPNPQAPAVNRNAPQQPQAPQKQRMGMPNPQAPAVNRNAPQQPGAVAQQMAQLSKRPNPLERRI